MNKIIPIILAGGTGSRLWPLSRESFPKQFLQLTDENNYTLLQQTIKRIEGLENLCKPIIICNEEHRFIVGDQMREIKTDPLAIILEPSRRNTAPAISIAALKAIELFKNDNVDPILLILSSDHYIEETEEFRKSIQSSIELAAHDNLIIFGIIPSHPATGYGYIKAETHLKKDSYIPNKVEKFIEKPDSKTAQLLFENKKYFWNSGMFVFKANSILKELSKFAPKIVENCKECLKESKVDLDFLRLDRSFFSKCPDISIDIAVFEKTKKAYVLPMDCGWNDIGNWESLWNISKKDVYENSIRGNVVVKNSERSLIRSEDKLIVCIGLKDLMIIDTKDALLVSNKSFSQEIKNIVSTLNKKNIKEGKQHKKIYRPWGYYESIEESKNWQIKKIEVNPGASLSLQLHNHRSEHWIVVEGTAKVQVDDEKKILQKNESIYIPLKSKHRLSNNGQDPLVLIEVQTGFYLGEDDIIRFDDIYGRISNF
tara:strand:+ start:2257 stop:3708 length:1452 start_codon:yes stop_codon:yes gene_type:complete